MTWNDLECPIQLKMRTSHGLLADSVDTSLATFYIGPTCNIVQQMLCSVKCTISERAEKDVCS